MNAITRGIVAGFVATVVLSVMMMGKAAMGVMPALDPVGMIANMMGVTMAMGWVIHFMIGTIIWGVAFVALRQGLPGGQLWVKGILLGVGAWLLMMVAVMPMAGAGLFGMQMGMMAPVMTLVMHIIYGAVLGGVYAALPGNSVAAAR